MGDNVYLNGKCVPPEIFCENGKFWDQMSFTCKCPDNKWDNSTHCVSLPSCSSNKIYSSLTNECVCPRWLIWLESENKCVDPSCPENQRWDGRGCIDISCPPNSYFNGS